MGLDITYYEKVEPTENPTVDDLEDGVVIPWHVIDDKWSSRLAPISADYVRPSGREGSFRAGSYGGYNEWRNLLAQVIHDKNASWFWSQDNPQGPFAELIDFADNQGVIGPETSAKLAKDFEDYGEKFGSDSRVDDYDRQRYANWCKAFQTAAHGGCVEFH